MVTLIKSLFSPACYNHPTFKVELRETHISWVILTGDFAYKIKKPVNMGFLDFSSLEKRKFYCEEEIRLNRRLAPDIYLEIVSITGSAEYPIVGGDGPVLEYAVRMKEFPPDQTLDKLLMREAITTEHIDLIAKLCAKFHSEVERTGTENELGSASLALSAAIENFQSIENLSKSDSPKIKNLLAWTENQFSLKESVFVSRKKNGFVRECHGDLHLGNMALAFDRVILFDCIEFNERFRWIDVMSEVAFVVMDLLERKRPDYAWRFLNKYLEYTGDYEGLAVLRFYLTYRAMVRAKVANIRLHQKDLFLEDRSEQERIFHEYLELADFLTRCGNNMLMITCGFSGSGKTYLARMFYELGIIHLRSDVERKRIFNLIPNAKSGSSVGDGLYTLEIGNKTYERLSLIANILLQEGFTVIVDATFLEAKKRDIFQVLASERGVKYLIVHCTANENMMKKRILDRISRNDDASEASLEILEHQMAIGYAFTELEKQSLLSLNTGDQTVIEKAKQKIRELLNL